MILDKQHVRPTVPIKAIGAAVVGLGLVTLPCTYFSTLRFDRVWTFGFQIDSLSGHANRCCGYRSSSISQNCAQKNIKTAIGRSKTSDQ